MSSVLDTILSDSANMINWTWRRITDEITYRVDGEIKRIRTMQLREKVLSEDLAFFNSVVNDHFEDRIKYINMNIRLFFNDKYNWVNIIGSVVERDDHKEPMVVRGIALDVNDIQHNQSKSFMTYDMFSRFMDENPGVAYIVDCEGKYIYGNKSWVKQFTSPLESLLGKTNFDLFRPEIASQFEEENREALLSDEAIEMTYPMLSPLGETTWYTTVKFKIVDNNDNYYVAGYTLDITPQKKQEVNMNETNELLKVYMQNISDVVIVLDIEGNILDCNLATLKVLGYRRQQLMNMNIGDIMVSFNQDDFVRTWVETSFADSIQDERILVHRNGENLAFDVNSNKVSTSMGERIISVCRNLNPFLESEAKIERLAYYDQLTQLPNRTNFNRYLTSIISEVDKPFHLLFLDLDNFKFINDVYGHDFGDRVLVEVAKRLKGVKGMQGFAARLSGDEFILITEYLGEDSANTHARNLIQGITKAIVIDNIHIDVTCSVGVVNFPVHGKTNKELLRNADIAMYKAKEVGKNQAVLFEQDMLLAIQHKSILANAMIEGLKKREFRMVYQPILNADGISIKGFEALLRWDSESLGQVSPGEFIPIAEETGVIIELGYWLMREVFKQSAKWEEYYPKQKVFLTMNISAVQIMQENFLEYVRNALSETGANPRNMVIEVTENVLLESTDYHINKLNMLRALGFQIAMDDYGTGYTSMNYIRVFPIGIIKIDRSYISDIGKDRTSEILIESFVYFAHRLDMRVVAEGIETKEQLAFLQKLNIDCYQGFYFSKPLSTLDAQRYLKV